MSIEQKYREYLKTFFLNNREYFNNLKSFNKDGEKTKLSSLSYLDYLPDDKSSSLDKDPVIVDFLDGVFENFINIDGLKYNLHGHTKELDNRLFKDVLADSDLYHLTKENIINEFKDFILIDLFDVFLSESLNGHTPSKMSSFIMFEQIHQFIGGDKCDYCSTSVYAKLDYASNEIQLSSHLKACPRPDVEETSITIDLKTPSKKLVFLNSPKKFVTVERNYKLSLGSILGEIHITKEYADKNIGYFLVSNTSPRIYQNDTEILIASINEESDRYEELIKTHKDMGMIITDLWAYVVLDYDLFNSLCTEKGVDTESIEYTVVNIPSEQITIVHTLNINEDTTDFSLPFSKITF